MNLGSSLWDRLDEAVHRHQQQLGDLPYVQGLIQGTVPQTTYLGHLQAMAVVHGVMETALDEVESPILAAHWKADLGKGHLLRADLDALSPSPQGIASPADEAALQVTERIRLRFVRDPLSLLGYLFALQEAGAAVPVEAKRVGKLFQLPPQGGVRYLSSFEPKDGGSWTNTRQALEAEAFDPEQTRTILEAAEEALAGIREVLSSLHPVQRREPSLQAVGLNPEAGRHPVPSDPREVRAAIEGGRRTWEKIPYYGARYGKRGERFTNSDGAWIVTLAEYPQETVTGQVEWLSRVLASRGMPRLTMEVSLREIHDALMEAVPEKGDQWKKLLVVADALQASRTSFLDDAEQEALAQAFHEKVSAEGAGPGLDGTGRLLVSAVMDELAGVDGVVDSLKSWMTDPERFSGPWIEAVHETLRQAARKAKTE